MNRFLVTTFSLILIFSCKSNEIYDADALFITNINTIDPQEGLKENQTLIIKNGKITSIVASDQINLSSKNMIIDGKGKYLMPGLWDTHVHFAYIEDLAPIMFNLFLRYGITSVRDTGGKKEFVTQYRNQALQNPSNSPRVMIAGPLLDGAPNVYDGSDEGHPPLSVRLNTVDDVKKEVRVLDSLHVDFLKAYEMLTPEQFKTLVGLGKELGLKITGHVPLSMSVIDASNAGLSSMEHMRNLELACASNADELLMKRKKMLAEGKNKPGGELRSSIHNAQREEAIKNFDVNKANEVLAILKANNTWQIPTLALGTFSTEKFMRYAWWKESIQYFPEKIKASWEVDAAKVDTAKVPEFRKQYSQWMINMVKMIHEKSITIMAGTDTPIAFQPPGISLHHELAMLVKAGLTPLEAIQTATINPAKYFNLEKELGSIREGQWADLLILNSNPLENIENTKSIESVIKQGKFYSKTDLESSLLK